MMDIKDNEWVRPVHKDYKLRCCDCDLTHRVDFRIVGKDVQFKVRRDNRSTGQARRHREDTRTGRTKP